jgi:hypothetical protein
VSESNNNFLANDRLSENIDKFVYQIDSNIHFYNWLFHAARGCKCSCGRGCLEDLRSPDDWVDATLKVIQALGRQLSEEQRVCAFAADARDVFHPVAAVLGELRDPA